MERRTSTTLSLDSRMIGSSHFAVGSRVSMPVPGDKDVKWTEEDSKVVASFNKPRSKKVDAVSRDYLKKISTDMCFTEDVVRQRAAHTLPYDPKYLKEAFDISNIREVPLKTGHYDGRQNASGPSQKHMPCNLTSVDKYSSLKPPKKKEILKALKLHQEMMKKSYEVKDETQVKGEEVKAKKHVKDGEPEHKKKDDTKSAQKPAFLTEVSGKKRELSPLSTPSGMKKMEQLETRLEWDAYLVSQLSKNTAHWIVHQKMPMSTEKDMLNKLLTGWYGKPDHIDLVRDDASENELDISQSIEKLHLPETRKKKWESKGSLLQRVYGSKGSVRTIATDPYSEDSKAPFYRQPAGFRKQQKDMKKEEAAEIPDTQEEDDQSYEGTWSCASQMGTPAPQTVCLVHPCSGEGAINATARDIRIVSYKPPPPPTLRDVINPKVGDKFYDTQNRYEQEWLSGTNQVESKDPTCITLENQSKYRKQLQPIYPHQPEFWHPRTDQDRKGSKDREVVKKVVKGGHRWKDLPYPIDDMGEALDVVPPGYDPEYFRSPDPCTRRLTKQNAALLQIVEDWRAKWHLSGQYEDSSPDDLIQDMADVQAHVRLKAIATVSVAAAYKPPADPGIHLDYQEKMTSQSSLPEKIFIALECLLEDPHDRVKKAAAITLYALNHPSEAAEVILRDALAGQNVVDRWAAAQCLAHYGVCDSEVVAEIISQLLSSEDAIKHERAITLLSKISANSTLVHCMVAEQLNSSSWRHRVIACKTLPTLDGTVNKDITQKLSDLMWNDWHTEVRKSAAQCLGKTGHGRDVHDDLRDRIINGPERVRLEALSRVGQLGIMTAKLLPAYLECFDDVYVSVRSEACITAGNLQIREEQVVSKLVHLATFDPVWKVKALAMQALGKIGLKSDSIKETLVWALRYEEKPAVRAEACNSIRVLDFCDDDVIDIMQERLLVETNPMVREQIMLAMDQYGINTTEDMDMVAQIKEEVHKLCTRNIVASHIIMNEEDEVKRENIERMIYETKEEFKRRKIVRPSETYLYRRMLMQKAIENRVMHDPRFRIQISVLEPPHEREAKYESVIKRIKSLSRTGTLSASPTAAEVRRARIISRMSSSSPSPSHEGTMFTPTADRELEALFSREGTAEAPSPSTGASTPGQKYEMEDEDEDEDEDESSPLTQTEQTEQTEQDHATEKTEGDQNYSHYDDNEDEDDYYDEKDEYYTENDDEYSEDGKDKMTSATTKYEEDYDYDEDESRTEATAEGLSESSSSRVVPETRSGSNVRFNEQLEVPGIEIASASPNMQTFLDDLRRHSRISLNPSTVERRSILSRETLAEREKITSEAKVTFTGLDHRYAHMVPHLREVDKGFTAVTQPSSATSSQSRLTLGFGGDNRYPLPTSKPSSRGSLRGSRITSELRLADCIQEDVSSEEGQKGPVTLQIQVVKGPRSSSSKRRTGEGSGNQSGHAKKRQSSSSDRRNSQHKRGSKSSQRAASSPSQQPSQHASGEASLKDAHQGTSPCPLQQQPDQRESSPRSQTQSEDKGETNAVDTTAVTQTVATETAAAETAAAAEGTATEPETAATETTSAETAAAETAAAETAATESVTAETAAVVNQENV